MINVVKEIGDDDVARVYIGKLENKYVEFAESVQHAIPRCEKWVIIISCLFGCPIHCLMCDAGQKYEGRLTKEQMFEQIEYVIQKRFPSGVQDIKKFKIQFTRMGEPSFNPAVLEVLDELQERYHAPGLIPSVSTIGPKNCMGFFKRLCTIKKQKYRNGKFQLQFSIHTTDLIKRAQLIPTPQMTFDEIAAYGNNFFEKGDRKITLNFIVMEDYPLDVNVLKSHFNPNHFIVKLTPLNPTFNAQRHNLQTKLHPYGEQSVRTLVENLQNAGFETIISIGNPKENRIGSNCGQYVTMLNLNKEGNFKVI